MAATAPGGSPASRETVVIRFAADGAVTSPTGLSAGSGPRWIAPGPGGTLWLALETARAVARITGVGEPAPPSGGGTAGGEGGGGPVAGHDSTGPLRRHRDNAEDARGARASVRLTLSERATATLRLQRLASGGRVGRRCVKPSRARRGAARCTRLIAVGKPAVRSLGVGSQIVKLAGGRTLAPGRYRLSITARDAAGNRTAKPRVVGFKVAARREPPATVAAST